MIGNNILNCLLPKLELTFAIGYIFMLQVVCSKGSPDISVNWNNQSWTRKHYVMSVNEGDALQFGCTISLDDNNPFDYSAVVAKQSTQDDLEYKLYMNKESELDAKVGLEITHEQKNRAVFSYTIKTHKAVAEMSGKYICKVTNSDKQLTLDLTVNDKAKPVLSLSEGGKPVNSSVELHSGSNVTITCNTSSATYPKPILSITRDGRTVKSDGIHHVTTSNEMREPFLLLRYSSSMSLAMRMNSSFHLSNYSCELSKTSIRLENWVVLNVTYAPELSGCVDKSYYPVEGVGYAINVTCHINANPPIKDWSLINLKTNQSATGLLTDSNHSQSAEKLVLKFQARKWSESLASEYQLTAYNTVGNTSAVFTLQKLKPRSVNGITRITATLCSVILLALARLF